MSNDKEREAFEAWYADDGGPQRMYDSYSGEYVEQAEHDAAWAAWQARASTAAAPESPVAEFRCWEEPRYMALPKQLYEFNLTKVGHDLPPGKYAFYTHPAPVTAAAPSAEAEGPDTMGDPEYYAHRIERSLSDMDGHSICLDRAFLADTAKTIRWFLAARGAAPQGGRVVTGIDPMQDPNRPSYFIGNAGNETPAENVLRKLASYLGAGGYNAPTVDAEVFHEKIMGGIENAIKDAVRLASPPVGGSAGVPAGEAWLSLAQRLIISYGMAVANKDERAMPERYMALVQHLATPAAGALSLSDEQLDAWNLLVAAKNADAGWQRLAASLPQDDRIEALEWAEMNELRAAVRAMESALLAGADVGGAK